MSSAFAPGELDHLPPEKAERVRRLFDIHAVPEGGDYPYDHAPGEAWPIDGPLPVEMDDHPPVEDTRK